QRPGALLLLRREAQSIGVLEDMHGTGVSIELGRKGQPHAPAGPQVADLLLRQAFHGPLFHAGIWLVALRQREARGNQQDQCSNRTPHCVSLSWFTAWRGTMQDTVRDPGSIAKSIVAGNIIAARLRVRD